MATHFFNFHLNNRHNTINLMNVDAKRYKFGKLLIFACFFLYASSMAAKGIFTAQTKFIVDLWGLDYATASLANTYYFVTYGIVQVGLFFIMSKISMRKYLLWTVPFSAVTTALIGLSTGIEQIWIYFGLCGAFQAGIYAGCNMMLTRYLPVKLLTKANTIMTLGYATGTVFAYLLSALFIGFGGEGWRVPYYIVAAILFVAVITFAIIVWVARRFARINNYLDEQYVKEIKTKKMNALDDSDPLINIKTKKKTIIFYAVDLVMAFMITAIYYCVMNYITTLLVEVYSFPQDTSIYVSIIAPIAIAVGPMITIRSCDKHKDFIRQALKFTVLILPIPLIMTFFYDVNVVLALGLSLIFVVFSNGVKAIILSVMAFKMRKVINVGAYSVISNAVASVSAGVVPTIIGAIIDIYGWSAAYLTTFAIVVVTTLLIIAIDISVRREYRNSHNMLSSENID